MQEYDCTICRLRGKDKERACFRYHELQPIARVVPDGRRYHPIRDRTVTRARHDVWNTVLAMEERWPERDVLFHLRMLNVCPEGMVLPQTRGEFLYPEMMCETYHVSPVTGGLNTWPTRIVEAFAVIRSTHNDVRNERMKDQIEAARNAAAGRK